MKLFRGTLVRCPFFRLGALLAVSAVIWYATPTAQRDFGAAATRARCATVMSMQSHAVKSLLSACLAAAPCHHGNWYGSCHSLSRRVNPINTFAAKQRRCVLRQRR